ncbi:triose-phosphate isomerase [Candidatus Pacearchaeota archaeon]|nr:triose-phosphate isomerase [Candidatus Pacearchaeota archaeon]
MIIVINLKTYRQGDKARQLVHAIERANEKAIVCVQATDLYKVISDTKLRVFAQHVDPFKAGRNTGYVIPEAIKAQGARGSLLNHSENKISLKQIKETIKLCRKNNLKIIACASSIKEAQDLIPLNPWAIAYEDPNLISTGKPISEYDSENVKKFAELVNISEIISLCGAGISNKEDILKAEELGCKGVLISSAIAKNGKVEIIK